VKRKERSTRNACIASALLSMRPGRTIQRCDDVFFRLGARDAAVARRRARRLAGRGCFCKIFDL
jgi:hypothetical protein